MKERALLILILCLFSILLKADFDVERFTDPAKYNWDTESNYRSYRQEMQMKRNLINFYEMKKSNVNTNVLRSAVFPGWGHFAVEKYTRGEVLMGLEVVFLGTAFYYYNQAMGDYDKYKKADYIVDIEKYYDRAQENYSISQTFIALGILNWLFSMYDTIIVTRQYNSQLWEILNKKYLNDKVELSFSSYPLGIEIRF